MQALVVYYSRSGHTRGLAEDVAVALDAHLEPVVDGVDRRGIFGYLRSGAEASFGVRPRIVPTGKDVSSYDLVVVGTPVWRMSVSSPVRAFLVDHARDLRSVAFFCTMGGLGSRHVFRQMEQLARKRPIATLARSERQLAQGDLPRVIEAFAFQLRTAMGEARPRVPMDGRLAAHAH